MKVYAVTTGSYSDYGIEAVFSTRQAAEEFRKSYDAVHNDYGSTNELIEEYDLFDTDPGMWELFLCTAHVIGPSEGEGELTMAGDFPLGRTNSRWEIGPQPQGRPKVSLTQLYVYPDVEYWQQQNMVGKMFVGLAGRGPDRDALFKALSDRVAEVKANWTVYQARGKNGNEREVGPYGWEEDE